MISNINKLKKIIKNRKIYIYGVNLEAIGFVKLLKQVDGFVDSRKFKNNKKIGIDVIKPDEFWKKYNKKEHFILIATKYRSIKKEVIDILEKKGSILNIDYSIITQLCPYLPTVEIVGECNLKCTLCELNAKWGKRLKMMNVVDFKKVILKLKKEIPFFNSVYLYLWGEPTLHPDIDKIINIAHKYNIACDVSTNLNTSNIKKLVLANPDILNIPVPGIKERYEKHYKKGKWEKFLKNLYLVKELIDKFDLDIGVRLDFHVYKDTLEDLEYMDKVAKELDFYLFPIMGTLFPGYLYKHLIYNEPFNDEIIKLSENFIFPLEYQIKKAYENRNKTCPFKNAFPVIRSDLSVNLCCNMIEPKLHHNYLNVSLTELKKLRVDHKYCQECKEKGIHRFFDLGIKIKKDKNKFIVLKDL